MNELCEYQNGRYNDKNYANVNLHLHKSCYFILCQYCIRQVLSQTQTCSYCTTLSHSFYTFFTASQFVRSVLFLVLFILSSYLTVKQTYFGAIFWVCPNHTEGIWNELDHMYLELYQIFESKKCISLQGFWCRIEHPINRKFLNIFKLKYSIWNTHSTLAHAFYELCPTVL